MEAEQACRRAVLAPLAGAQPARAGTAGGLQWPGNLWRPLYFCRFSKPSNLGKC